MYFYELSKNAETEYPVCVCALIMCVCVLQRASGCEGVGSGFVSFSFCAIK